MRTIVCTAALLVFLIAILHEAEAQCGGFQESCQDFSIGTNGLFSAQCKTENGNLVDTSINLDFFLGNDDGNLIQGGSGFSRSCQNEVLVDESQVVFIVAECKKTDGTLVSTSYDISNNLVNNNGELSWNFCSTHLPEVTSKPTVHHTQAGAREGLITDECGGFQESCQDFSIGTNGVFSAKCKTESGKSVDTSINLDFFLGNDDGNLIQGGGGFSRSCQNEVLVDESQVVFIVAECKKTDGTLVSTSYDISNNLVNNNGELSWNFCSTHLPEVTSKPTVHHTQAGAREGLITDECGGFQESCQDFSIGTNGVFSAKCKTESGKSVDTSINLDFFLGNDDGNLIQGGSGFSRSCQNEVLVDESQVVFILAECKKTDGTLVSTSYDISNNLVNNNGELSWNFCSTHLAEVTSKPTVHHTQAGAREGLITDECGGFQESCQDFSIGTNGVFSAKCKTESGKSVDTSINLDFFLGNDDGNLIQGGSGFSRSCQNEVLVDESQVVFILAECKKTDGTLVSTSYDISNNLVNNNGELSWNFCSTHLAEVTSKPTNDHTQAGAKEGLIIGRPYIY